MFKQYELPYGFDALEPYIDKLTMETHYGKHHSGYTNNFNVALEKIGSKATSAEEILRSLNSINDESLKVAIRNNGGGYWNHNLYFSILAPNGLKKPKGALLAQINRDFTSYDKMVETLSNLGISRFGSGWAWLSKTKEGKLVATSTANQDNPLMEDKDLTPILGIDVWEHAYYLKYKNLRGDYIKAFWEVVDWTAVEKLYEL
ncbi:MAG: superoxide dismutase [Sphaerochaetaceae bacterium]|nr:superoxide dismutase [Candidatus Cloacimonadota bacterium]